MMKISLISAWFDLWIGAYWDKKKNWLYILPFPMIGIILKFKHTKTKNEVFHDDQGMLPLDYDKLPKKLQNELFKRHEHVISLNGNDYIVYNEKNVLELLRMIESGNYH